MLYLRSDEVSRVAGSHQEAVIRTELFSETEVTDPQRLRISRFINVQDVTGLQVSVYYLQKIAVSIRLTHTHTSKLKQYRIQVIIHVLSFILMKTMSLCVCESLGAISSQVVECEL